MLVRLVSVLLLPVSAVMFSGCGAPKTGAARKPAQPERPRAFLLAKDIHQWLDFDYEYDYSATDSGANASRTSHNALLQNTYHFDTLYAVLRPKLLMGHVEMDVGFDGEWQKNETMGEDMGTNPTVEYRLDGTFFKDEDYPVDFASYYTKDIVNRVFSSNYDMDLRGESLGFTYEHPSLITHVGVSQSEGETSGLTNDRTSNSKNFLFNSTHRYKDFCSTSFSMMKGLFDTQSSMEDDLGTESETDSYMVSNNLDFSRQNLMRYLESQYSYSDSTSEYGDQGVMIEDWNKNSIWTERLFWQMGRALHTGLDYKDLYFQSTRNEQQTRMADGWFRHKLFDNFRTNFRIGDRESEFLDGTESEWAGNLNFNYTRHLPRESNLSIGLDNYYGVTDRNLESDLMQVVDVSFLYDATKFNYLPDYDIVLDTIVVRNKARTQVYDEGIDYTVERVGRQTRIEIPPGSAISDGDQLSIDYDYLTNPDIKYANKGNSFYTAVDLFDNSYRLMGQVSQGSQELLEGDDLNVALNDFTQYMFGVEKKVTFFTLKCQYEQMESTTEKYHSWEPSVEYRRFFNLYHLAAKIRARQTEFEEVTYREYSSEAGSEKSLLGQVNLRKRLVSIPGALWETRADYLQLSGRGDDDTEVSVNSAIQISVGKSRIRLEGEISWRDDNGRQSQDAFVLLQFRRFFR